MSSPHPAFALRWPVLAHASLLVGSRPPTPTTPENSRNGTAFTLSSPVNGSINAALGTNSLTLTDQGLVAIYTR